MIKILLNKINLFCKIAGLTLSDDLANHIYVNTILQNLPKDEWPEVYVNYGIEGADKAIEYGVKVVLDRLLRESGPNKEKNKNLDYVVKLQSGDYDPKYLLNLKEGFKTIGYDSEYRKPWIITISRLADLAKAKKELENAIKNKKDPKFIFDKKVELNIALNMFYDSAHSGGSILEHLSSKEEETLKNKALEKIKEKKQKVISEWTARYEEISEKYDADFANPDAEKEVFNARNAYFKQIEKLRTLEEEIELSNNYDLNKIHKLLKLLDISRLSDSSDIISMIKPHLDNPAKYEGHQEYTGFYPKKLNYERANAELQKIKIRKLITKQIKGLTEEVESLSDIYRELEKTNINFKSYTVVEVLKSKLFINNIKPIVLMIINHISDIVEITNGHFLEANIVSNLRKISNQIGDLYNIFNNSKLDKLNILKLLKQIQQKAFEALQLL